MDTEEELEKILEDNKKRIEKFQADEKQRKTGELIIGVGVSIVMIGLALIFTTSIFDLLMPSRSVNDRVMAVISIMFFTVGIHSLFTGVAVGGVHFLSLTHNKKNPIQFIMLVCMCFGVGVFMLYLSFFD